MFKGSIYELKTVSYNGDVPRDWQPFFKGARKGKDYRVIVRLSDNALVMSDTPAEKRSCKQAIDEAFGDVLIVGLGLNLINDKVLKKDGVSSVITMENDPDIIKHIATKTDVLEWDTRVFNPALVGRFDYIYWDALDGFNVSEFKSYLKPNGKLSAWDIDYVTQ